MAKFLKLFARFHINLIVLSAILCLQDRHSFCLADKTKHLVCKTPECRELGAYYIANMNKDANPCHDFYDYVCHGWEKHHPLPLYSETWAVPHVLEEKAVDDLRKILESTAKSPDDVDVDVAKLVYRKCLEIPYFQKHDPNAVRRIIKKVDNWPMQLPKDQDLPKSVYTWKIDNAYLKIAGESALFGYEIIGNFDKSDRITLVLGSPHSVYGMLNRKLKWTREEAKHYKTFLQRIINSVYRHTEEQQKQVIDTDLAEVLRLRDTLSHELMKNAYDDYQEMTLKEFQTWYNKELIQSSQLAVIDWFEQVRAIRAVEATDKLKVRVSKAYFTLLANTLRNTGKRVFANHIHLYFAERHIILDSSMTEALEHSIAMATSNPSGLIRYENERWQQCIDNHNMVHTLGRMYVKVHFPKMVQHEIQQLLEIAKTLQKAQITESTWLDRITKIKAMKKIDNLKAVIGHPEWYDKIIPASQRDKTNQDPLESNAIYHADHNRLFIGAAYLKLPVYGQKLPFVIEYGATLSLLGHELYHAFDEEGIKYDENKKIPLLGQHLTSKFAKSTQCFQGQYNKYKERELSKLGHHLTVDDRMTLGEDIADVMGLKLAYLGYLRKLRNQKGACSVLEGFENFSCERMFFIAYANTQCHDSSQRSRLYSLFTDRHSLSSIRVNGAVANMKEFSDAFNCRKNDRLNAAKRCDLWKD